MPKSEALTGIVSLDLTREPSLPEDHGTLMKFAQDFAVTDEPSYAEAARLIQQSSRFSANVEAFFSEGKANAHKAHKWFCDRITAICKPYDVRPVLEPKMKAFRAKQERERQEAERRVQAEADRQRREAEAEARRIQAVADAQATELRKAGEMRAAREAESAAQQQAQAVVQQAEELADIGTILPDAKPLGGPGEARIWVAEVVDIKLLCRAIADGTVDLEQMMSGGPKNGQMVPLLTVNQSVVDNLAKRMGREDIGIPGVRGTRGLQLRFSSKEASAPYAKKVAVEEEGW